MLGAKLNGENIGKKPLTYSNISNCITHIPQNIKLELKDGALILKAGSKVYIPNGFDVFEEKIIPEDCTPILPGNDLQYMVCCQTNLTHLDYTSLNNVFSGPTNPDKTYSFWYDTTNNIVNLFIEDKVNPARTESLPFAIITVSGGKVTSIDQVFNGFGYIGATVFALPGIKGLIPNGRNEDGSLNNKELTIDKVLIRTGGSGNEKTHEIGLTATSIGLNNYIYNNEENLLYYTNGSLRPNTIAIGTAEFSTSSPYKVIAFRPKTNFISLDYSDIRHIGRQALPSDRYVDLSLGTSGTTYTAPADGYVAIRQYFVSEYSKNFVGIYTVEPAGIDIMNARPAQSDVATYMPIQRNRKFMVYYNNLTSNNDSYFRFVYLNSNV